MDLKPLADIVKNIVPALGSALLSPVGSVVGSLIANTFGGDVRDIPGLLKKITEDPEAQAKLIALHYQHEESILALETADRQDARKMASTCKDWVVHCLAFLYTVGLFTYLGFMIYHPWPEGKEIFHELLNVNFLIISFYFGSAYGMIKNKPIP